MRRGILTLSAIVAGLAFAVASVDAKDCCEKAPKCKPVKVRMVRETCCQAAPAPTCCKAAAPTCCKPAPAPTCCKAAPVASTCCANAAPCFGNSAPVAHGAPVETRVEETPAPPKESAPKAPVTEKAPAPAK